ncbi:transglycosylase domain-containing protein [Membranihabitans marinus]|uniref:transglycosylase domain-containing protein n=1 Tax=Membranihabitans marinus TaxID=1227546 RepID=UPI001F2C3B99|nr:transglycosylase domain-containing protein [Membranihabitans marinus]
MSDKESNLSSEPTAEKKWKKTLVRGLWMAIFGGFLAAFFIIFIFSLQKLPTFDDLENPTDDIATEVYFSDNTEMGRFFIENRVPITYEEISPNVINALISTEDERYYGHSGIDFMALVRVAVKSLILGQKNSGGGSTITQQLAKLLYTEKPAGSIFQRAPQKLKEWITAVKLERSYTKEEIITMYLNEFDFLYDSHGIRAASETYFNTSPSSLTLNEAATLVGMLKNPTQYNPRISPEKAISRRNVVLGQMEKHDHIDKATLDSLKGLPIDMTEFSRTAHDKGPAPYFRMELKKHVNKILSEKAYLKPDGSKWHLEKDGLKIYTTLDRRMQMHAENAVEWHLKNLQPKLFKHWGYGATPWSYGTDKEYVKLKYRQLDNLKMESSRYKAMKAAEFDPYISEIESVYGNVEFTPYTMVVLTSAAEGDEYFQALIDEKVISEDRAKYLLKVAKSKEFQLVKEKWESFNKKADKVFNTPIEMSVFAYNEDHHVDTIMSPMDSIRYHRMILQAGVLAIEPGTGYVKAWVGGANFKYFQQDHIYTRRQVGSTFKPFIYSTSIAIQGISPCTKVQDIPYTIVPGESNFNLIKEWTPKNANGEYLYEPITLYQGLRESKNSISVYLIKELRDVAPVIKLVSNMGIDPSYLPNEPSICLGVPDLSLMQMTGAYTTFANNGNYVTPTFIRMITDENGKVIYKSITEEQQALQPDANYVMVDMLKNVARGRPGINQLKTVNGGKTGTTQNQTDGWYMGITPNLVTGVWVGGEDRWIRFRSLAMGQGSVLARPIFSEFLKNVENDPELNFDTQAQFFKPPGELDINIDCELYEQQEKNLDHPEDSPIEEEFFEG